MSRCFHREWRGTGSAITSGDISRGTMCSASTDGGRECIRGPRSLGREGGREEGVSECISLFLHVHLYYGERAGYAAQGK